MDDESDEEYAPRARKRRRPGSTSYRDPDPDSESSHHTARHQQGKRPRRIPSELVEFRGELLDRHWPDEGCSECIFRQTRCLRPALNGKRAKCQGCVGRGKLCDCSWIVNDRFARKIWYRVQCGIDLVAAEMTVYPADLRGGAKDKVKYYPVALSEAEASTTASASVTASTTVAPQPFPASPQVSGATSPHGAPSSLSAAPQLLNVSQPAPSHSEPPSSPLSARSFDACSSVPSNIQIASTQLYQSRQQDGEELVFPRLDSDQQRTFDAALCQALRGFHDNQQLLGPDATEAQLLRMHRKAIQAIWNARGTIVVSKGKDDQTVENR